MPVTGLCTTCAEALTSFRFSHSQLPTWVICSESVPRACTGALEFKCGPGAAQEFRKGKMKVLGQILSDLTS